MRITALEEYGLRCLLALAREGTDGQLSISMIAEKEGLSIPYASKLLSLLRQAGLVNAVRGRGGGFCIARAPEEINLLDVITGLGGPLIDPNHCRRYTGQLDKCVHTDDCSVHYTLVGLARYVGEFLSNMSLRNVMDGADLDRISRIETRVQLVGGKESAEKNEPVTDKDTFNI